MSIWRTLLVGFLLTFKTNPFIAISILGIMILVIYFIFKSFEANIEVGLKMLVLILLIIFLLGVVYALNIKLNFVGIWHNFLEGRLNIETTTTTQLTNASGKGNLFT